MILKINMDQLEANISRQGTVVVKNEGGIDYDKSKVSESHRPTVVGNEVMQSFS